MPLFREILKIMGNRFLLKNGSIVGKKLTSTNIEMIKKVIRRKKIKDKKKVMIKVK